MSNADHTVTVLSCFFAKRKSYRELRRFSPECFEWYMKGMA